MPRIRASLTVAAVLLLQSFAFGQTTTVATSQPTLGASPSENAAPGSVRQRSPGTWISAARLRHNTLVDDRLRSSRYTGQVDESLMPSESSTGTSSSGLSGLLDSLLNSGILGSLGGSSGLGDLLTGVAGTGTSTTDNSTSTNTGTSTDASTYPPEVIAMLEAAGIDPTTLQSTTGATQSSREQTSTGSKSSATAQSIDQSAAQQTAGGAIGRLPKADSRAQTSDATTETSFQVRWANTLLTTLFTSLTVGFQSSAVIDLFADVMRNALGISTATDDTGDTATDGNTDGNTDTDTGTGTTDGGDGSSTLKARLARWL